MNHPFYQAIDQAATEHCAPPADNPDGLPYVVREGVLDLAGHKLKVMVLNTGERIFEAEEFERFLKETGLGGGVQR